MVLVRKISRDVFEIEEEEFAKLDINAPFFDIFHQMYGEYYKDWAERKKQDPVYTVFDNQILIGLLKLKVEEKEEDYTDITPILTPAKRMKISSLKTLRDYPGLGTMFMRIILEKSIRSNAEEIYGTVPLNLPEFDRVVKYLTKWGFKREGSKYSHGVHEDVYVLPLNGNDLADKLFNLDFGYER